MKDITITLFCVTFILAFHKKNVQEVENVTDVVFTFMINIMVFSDINSVTDQCPKEVHGEKKTDGRKRRRQDRE